MRHRSTRTLLALLTSVLLLALAACGGGDEPGDAAPGPREQRSSTAPAATLTAGTCWDDEQLPQALGESGFRDWVEKYAGGDIGRGESMRDDAAFSTQMPCAEDHSLELYDVVSLAPALTGRITSYAALLDQGSALYRQVRDQVNDRCLAGSAYGTAQRRAGGLPVQLGPSLRTSGSLHVAWDPFPADLWAQGQKKFVCTFEQDTAGTLRFADLTTGRVPVSERVCLDTPRRYRPCAGRHQAEDIGEMVLNTAIARGQVNGRRAVRTGDDGRYVALSRAEYAKLDRVCQTLLEQVSTPKRRAATGVRGRAYPGAVSQWPTPSGAYVASCFALKPAVTLPSFTGTVFDRS